MSCYATFLLSLAAVPQCMASAATTGPGVVELHRGWWLQSSSKATGSGKVMSSTSFHPKGWYSARVPTTVVNAQVESGEFPDPYFGMNLRKFPGMTYPIGLNTFNNLPMDKDSPYACSWWYRTEFKVPVAYKGKRIGLHFKGINYRANIWINGKKLADAKDVAGAYRIYEFDVSSLVGLGSNALAVEVFAPTEKELGINWVDWNPAPPDKDMGIWGDVYLSASGPVSVRYPQVVTHFSNVSLDQADLTVMAQLHNASDKSVRGVIEALVDRTTVRQNIALQPNETRDISFAPEKFPDLKVKQPKLWWPAEMGAPNLHDLTVSFLSGASLSDKQQVRFGIREVTSELTAEGYRLFRINGKKILIRGGGWSMDMLLRPSKERTEAQLQYVQNMNLNTVRLEAQLETDYFFDLADQKGLLIMAGWCCCDIWEQWDKWETGTLEVAQESLRTQTLRLRRHPSLIAWSNGSDGPPPAEVERAYLQVLKETAWPNPVLSSAADVPTTVTGPSGVKMTGPYDYEPPSYWFIEKNTIPNERTSAGDPNPNAMPGKKTNLNNARWGGAYGFNTETGPGAAIPPFQSLRKFIPKDHLWPIDEVWNYHSAGERFMTMHPYHAAMDATYGKPTGLEDYLRKSQAMAYDGQRAMFEAYSRNKYTSTGVIQWLLNIGWPSTFWHLWDYYLYPAGGYFGTKKAGEPVHVQYTHNDRSIVIVNTRREPVPNLTVSTLVYDFNLKEVFSKETKVNVDQDSSTTIMTIPAFPSDIAGAIYFVKLSMRDNAGKEISTNFYWVPGRLSTMAWDKVTDTAFAPIESFEDLTALNQLPAVRLRATARVESSDGVRVTLQNPSKNLAFQAHVGIRGAKSDEEILPVLWEDNYISLMPGEKRIITARYLKKDALGKSVTVVVDGWNIEPTSLSLAASTATLKPALRP
jgi:exo-1,4-beta-D-glucosaminidase